MTTKPTITYLAKVRVINEDTGREWIGYARRDHFGDEPTLQIATAGDGQRVNLRIDPRYEIELI